jgi:hypothetical protein
MRVGELSSVPCPTCGVSHTDRKLIAAEAIELEISTRRRCLSSLWRTAYVSAIFETNPAKMTLKIAEARAAFTERLNSPIEIGKFEHEGIEAARQRLATLEAQRVEVVKLAVSNGDTPS